MRFITRNLHQGGPKDFSALRKTLFVLHPDVLFVQECCDPKRYKDWTGYKAFWKCVDHGRWGSAILVRDDIPFELTELALPAFAGWMIVGKMVAANHEIQLINLHVPTGSRSYSLLALEALAALAPIIEQCPTILGGDWNVTVAVLLNSGDAIDLKGSRAVRQQLAKMKLVNAWQQTNPGEIPPRTLRHHFRLDSRPHHIDGFFTTPDLVPFLRSCEVLESPEWLDSDHNPVVIEFNF